MNFKNKLIRTLTPRLASNHDAVVVVLLHGRQRREERRRIAKSVHFFISLVGR